MKQFLIDLCLVLLLICVIDIFFAHEQVSQTLFERSLDEFEETVSHNQEVKDSYVVLQDHSDNQVSGFFKGVSQVCVQIIEFIVLVFSNFVSMILTYVVY